jgi:two-component system, OmpR family, phosphate regulon sensor histidine kinase PhoR
MSAGDAAAVVEHAEILFEVTRQFASSLELDTVLGSVLSLTVKAVRASVGSIWVLDGNGRVLRSILARPDLPPEVKYPTVKKVMSEGFAGWVYHNRQADIIYDTAEDARWYSFPDDTLVAGAAIAAPLIRRDQVIGVLTVTHPEPNHFTEKQLSLLEAIAIQAAVAVERATLYTYVNNERSMLRAVIGGVQDVILVTDGRGRVILANEAARRSLGLAKDFQHKSIETVLAQRQLLSFFNSLGDEETIRREVTLDDERVFDCTLVKVANMGKVLAMHDVTTFKKLDSLKNEFVSQVAHDLKAPLAIIHGYASLLAELPILQEEENIYVQPIISSIVRMRNLIDNILDIGRIEMGLEVEMQVLDMATALRQAVEDIGALAAEKGITLQMELGDTVIHVYAAPLRLQQAFANLLGNAIKFTPDGGTVTATLTDDGQRAVVAVKDTGPGIPLELQSRLFQKFSKLSQRQTAGKEGHGLGLAIVKSVVDAHNGRVWVESEVGEGSTFLLAIPLYRRAASSQ